MTAEQASAYFKSLGYDIEFDPKLMIRFASFQKHLEPLIRGGYNAGFTAKCFIMFFEARVADKSPIEKYVIPKNNHFLLQSQLSIRFFDYGIGFW